MILLGIETSGSIGSLAIRVDGCCLEECFLPELSRRQAQTLIPSIQNLLHRHQITFRDVDSVAVSIGPGSFTGLRVGVTFAKTLAFAADTNLVAVDSFQSIAENTPSAQSVSVIADAQQRGLMVGHYERSLGSRFERRGDINIVNRDELKTLFSATQLINGTGFEKLSDVADAALLFAPLPLRHSRAATIARLGEDLTVQGIFSDPDSLEPVYIRKSAAEEKREMTS